MSLADQPGHGGITVNDRGDDAVLGFWPEKFNAARRGSYVGQLRHQFGEAVKVAQRHHEQNRSVIMARHTRTTPTLPEPTVRQTIARQETKKLGDIAKAVAAVADTAFVAKAKLKPFDYGADVVDALARQELRSHLRTMKDDKRR